MIEYEKYREQLKETLNYFVGCSDAISFPDRQQQIIDFFYFTMKIFKPFVLFYVIIRWRNQKNGSK